MINSLTKEIDSLEIIFNRKQQLLKDNAQDTIAESLIKMGKIQSGDFLFYEKLSLTDILLGEGEGLGLDENNTWIALIKIDKNEFAKFIESSSLKNINRIYKEDYVEYYNDYFNNEYIKNFTVQADWGPSITNDYGDGERSASIHFEIMLQHHNINYSKEYIYKDKFRADLNKWLFLREPAKRVFKKYCTFQQKLLFYFLVEHFLYKRMHHSNM